MSFRTGNQGEEMFPRCQKLGVAAITYSPLEHTDLSLHARFEPKEFWKRLESTQHASLRRVAYEMQPGDVIYVKEGPQIIDKGMVTGAYKFDSQRRIIDPVDGLPWSHQVRVAWSEREFRPLRILLRSEPLTVKELNQEDVDRIEKEAGAAQPQASAGLPPLGARTEALLEDAYYRECPARLKVIVPRHNKLSNEFCAWLKSAHGVTAVQEQARIDVRFRHRDQSVIAELKVCYGVGSTKSIREALGQLLEYNHYPARETAESWLIVIDEKPSEADKVFIQGLRDVRALPIRLGWRSRKRGFTFHPAWQ